MLEVGVLKTWDEANYKAGVQLAGSLTTYFDDISVSVSIPPSAMVIGNYVILAIPGGNPKDAVILSLRAKRSNLLSLDGRGLR